MPPQKNTSITFALLTSVFMMMFVASLFHAQKGSLQTQNLMSNVINNLPYTGYTSPLLIEANITAPLSQ